MLAFGRLVQDSDGLELLRALDRRVFFLAGPQRQTGQTGRYVQGRRVGQTVNEKHYIKIDDHLIRIFWGIQRRFLGCPVRSTPGHRPSRRNLSRKGCPLCRPLTGIPAAREGNPADRIAPVQVYQLHEALLNGQLAAAGGTAPPPTTSALEPTAAITASSWTAAGRAGPVPRSVNTRGFQPVVQAKGDRDKRCRTVPGFPHREQRDSRAQNAPDDLPDAAALSCTRLEYPADCQGPVRKVVRGSGRERLMNSDIVFFFEKSPAPLPGPSPSARCPAPPPPRPLHGGSSD